VKSAERHHPSDERLVARYFDPSARDEALELHLFRCRRCASRRDELAATLDTDHDEVLATADRHFPAARLERQRAAILDRLSGTHARILPFPGSAPAAPFLTRAVRRSSRWTAAAAALMFAVSAGTGWWLERGASGSPRIGIESHAIVASAESHEYEDAMLSAIDVALAHSQADELQALDALTPRAGEQIASH
jgi:hypothetical protein